MKKLLIGAMIIVACAMSVAEVKNVIIQKPLAEGEERIPLTGDAKQSLMDFKPDVFIFPDGTRGGVIPAPNCSVQTGGISCYMIWKREDREDCERQREDCLEECQQMCADIGATCTHCGYNVVDTHIPLIDCSQSIVCSY